MGEHALEENKRSRLFSNIELSLWTACLGAYTYSHHSMLQYKSFAVEHAGVFSSGKDKKYWVDIGNYIDIENHNSEHLSGDTLMSYMMKVTAGIGIMWTI